MPSAEGCLALEPAGAGEQVESIAREEGLEAHKLGPRSLPDVLLWLLALTLAWNPQMSTTCLSVWLLRNMIAGKFFLESLLFLAVTYPSFLPALVREERASH